MIKRILQFAGASGAGLVLDYAIYTTLCASGLAAGYSNLISSACGVTFVFIVSAKRIFVAEHEFLYRKFLIYAAYQAVSISLFSLAVDGLTNLFDGKYLLGKTAVLPFTFATNFLFSAWLLRDRAAAQEPEPSLDGDGADRAPERVGAGVDLGEL